MFYSRAEGGPAKHVLHRPDGEFISCETAAVCGALRSSEERRKVSLHSADMGHGCCASNIS